jgi:hypothetical protein
VARFAFGLFSLVRGDSSSAVPPEHSYLTRDIRVLSMEGVAAFGLAANILQVIELTQKLLSTGHQIYQAGATVQNSELEVVLKDFTILNERLHSSAHPAPNVFGPITADGQVCDIYNRPYDLADAIIRASNYSPPKAKRSHKS